MKMTDEAPLARSPLHVWQEAHGARFGERHGWRLAESFAAQRSDLLLVDVTPFAKLAFTGYEILDLSHTHFPDPQPGRVVAVSGAKPGWLCHQSDEQLLFLSTRLEAEGFASFRLPGQPEHKRITTWDMTSAYAGFLLIGSDVSDVARLLGGHLNLGSSPSILSPGSCVETGFYGVPCLLARAPDDRPVVGMWVAWDVAEYVWDRLLQIGAAHGLAAAGGDVLREFGWQA
ncbi:MAG: hypothetical protein FJ271_09800 [Planctomycetes bacterium]|nr:hypothetical protein [Planctomycetota bacterium]